VLTDKQKIAREGKLTASRVACLMKADVEEIYNLWLEMTGDPSHVPEDLEDVWAVKLGEATEQLNLDWTERDHGKIIQRGEVVQHPKIDWAASTLDGWMALYNIPIEVKHNNGFEPVQQVIDRYQPQMHWQMCCTGAIECGFSVIRGTKQPEFYRVPFDPTYAQDLVARATTFMEAVRCMFPPVEYSPSVVPVFEAVRTVDMRTNTDWVMRADDWLRLKPVKDAFERANKEIKALVPDDAKIAWGAGVVAKRNKNGALTLKAGDTAND
jgi:hypothetical protein